MTGLARFCGNSHGSKGGFVGYDSKILNRDINSPPAKYRRTKKAPGYTGNIKIAYYGRWQTSLCCPSADSLMHTKLKSTNHLIIFEALSNK